MTDTESRSADREPVASCDAATLLGALDVAAPVGLFLLDRELRVRYLNRTAARLTGSLPGSALGHPADAVFRGVPTIFLNAARQSFATGESSGALELDVTPASGVPRTWWCTFFRQDGAEAGPMVGGVIIDMTERHLLDLGRAEVLSSERAARAELERVRDRLAFLVHASSRLTASLDVETTLITVGDLIVPRLAEICVIDLWDGQRLERAYVRGDDTTHPDVITHIYELSGRQNDDHPAVRAARTGKPMVVPRTTKDVAAAMYAADHDRDVVHEAVRGKGFTSVPLATAGRVIGVLSFVGPSRVAGRERSLGDDLTLLEQIASRAAQSIENARLFDAERRLARSLRESERRQRETALTLQRSLLPATTYQPAGLEVATRYLPGSDEAEVGGDWYDVIPLGPARTALVIGDVMGRGLRAATLMGQVRTAIRAYARQDLAPREILGLVDGIVTDLGTSELVTCVYAVFDATSGTLTYASAGHLPLLVAEPGRSAVRIDHEAGIALGVATCDARGHVIALAPGALVALYTDGLVERHDRDVDTGIDLLAALLGEVPDTDRQPSATVDDLCDRVLEALQPPGGYDDDVALLLARPYDSVPGAQEPHTMQLAVSETPSAAAVARHAVDRALLRWGLPADERGSIVLTTSELVANAVRHGAPPVRLHLRRRPTAVDIEVSDGAPDPPRPLNPAVSAESGRGLLLVSRLADRWGWRRTDSGKTVWCVHSVQPTEDPPDADPP